MISTATTSELPTTLKESPEREYRISKGIAAPA
jgi:hypothetical protein